LLPTLMSVPKRLYLEFKMKFDYEEVLDNPPAFEKQRCSICSKIINRGSEGYSVNPGNKLVCTYCNDLTLDIPQGE